MAMLRIQIEGCKPWDPLLVGQAIKILFPAIKYHSEQEHIDIMLKNNLKNSFSC